MVWIADSGAGQHLCGPSHLPKGSMSGISPCPDIRLCTANGTIVPRGRLKLHIPSLKLDGSFLLLRDSPPVLSIGQLVEKHGFSFSWTPEGGALFRAPDKSKIRCTVKDFVPLLKTKVLPLRANAHCQNEQVHAPAFVAESGCNIESDRSLAVPGFLSADAPEDGPHDEAAPEVPFRVGRPPRGPRRRSHLPLWTPTLRALNLSPRPRGKPTRPKSLS